nr:hypothetical protein CFP56_68125 [Quercus suber]
MSDGRPKPAIPAWQRAPTASQRTKDTPETEVEAAQEPTPSDDSTSTQDDTPPVESPASASEPSELEQVQSFLEDPAVQEASLEKKRGFLEKQGVSNTVIDQVLGPADTMANEFASFQQQTPSKSVATAPATSVNAPPIITYPEFLVDAHKTPPLITPSRVFNAAYFAAATAALIYGANQYLVTPMLSSLNGARHEFYTHSHTKVDEFNERLSKVVSKLPEIKKGSGSEAVVGDAESVAEDPTDLYHRDTGTQTSPELSPTSSVNTNLSPEPKKDTVPYHTNSLTRVKELLTAMVDRNEKSAEVEQERHHAINSLRHELDSMLYATPGVMMWGQGDDALTKNTPSKDEAAEMLKKEIRGVKGVLLSARRFPSARDLSDGKSRDSHAICVDTSRWPEAVIAEYQEATLPIYAALSLTNNRGSQWREKVHNSNSAANFGGWLLTA